jgi:hypothetical protein
MSGTPGAWHSGMRNYSYAGLPLLLATCFVACSGSDPGPGEAPPWQLQDAILTQAQSCDDLLGKLKADAARQMNARIDAQLHALRHADSVSDSGGVLFGDDGGGQAEDSGAGAAANGGPPAPEHSETNTQVEGIDEADIVKTDGNYLYILHGSSFTVAQAWPTSELAMKSSFEIEGTPSEMFVAGDQVVIYSSVDAKPVYEAAGKPMRPPYDPYGYGDMEGAYDEAGWAPQLTKITVLRLAGAEPSVEREVYFEGWYGSSRRIEERVRTVIRGGEHGPALAYWPNTVDYDDYPETAGEWTVLYEQLRASNSLKIAAATLDDFLPDRFERVDASVEVVGPSCTDFYVPTAGSTTYGMTQIASLDLADMAAPVTTVSVVGAAETIYSSEDRLVLASTWWTPWQWSSLFPSQPTVVDATFLHTFDIEGDPAKPSYVASGTVPGHIHDQFSLDEAGGLIRVTTTQTVASLETWETSNNLFVLGENGKRLETRGAVTGLAAGETIYSTRFVGDRAYVVTFRQVDPLFVVDLANPDAPAVLAELKIPGFSDYMHPLEDGKMLLTVGQDATDEGQVLGVALQLFDVTDPKNPTLLHKRVLDDDWGSTEASYNHKAFTFFDGKLALPYTGYSDQTGEVRSTLEIFAIDAATGISPVGSIDHSAFYADVPYDHCYPYGVRRGVFIEDFIYSISTGGVLVHDLGEMGQVASLELPALETDSGCYYY